jgi:uncharacterized protein YjbI with pentapeptide repeats
MANSEQVAILKQGVSVWNGWRGAHRDVVPDLALAKLNGADLSLADLSLARLDGAELSGASLQCAYVVRATLSRARLVGADLRGANLRGADLSDAYLMKAKLGHADASHANLARANLSETDLRNANFFRANMSGAYLSGADLSDAGLSGVDLSGATLRGADLSGVYMSNTSIAGCDLRWVRGLELVRHDGPSYVSIDTVYKSEGKIPDGFLLGCGVPDSFIAQIPALIGALQPIQFYSCFISYSTKDEEFARRLHERMRAEKLRVWFAPEDVQGGKKLHEQIERAIQVHDRLLLVLSENSIHSEWVMTEIRNALKVEKKDGRRKLFPIRLCDFDTLRRWECVDADFGKDLANEVRQYFIPDFSNWKNHDDFEPAFAKLLRDLRASES